MNNKFKTLLKTTVAVASLIAGSQTWGAGAWYNADTGLATGTPWALPTTEVVTAVLSAGDGSTQATTFNPTVSIKTLNLHVAAQSASCTNALTVAIPVDDMVINVRNNSTTGRTFLLTLTGNFRATVNLELGDVTLAAPVTANYLVNVLDNLTLTPGSNATDLSYKVTSGKTLILGGAFAQTTAGRIKGTGATITTPASICTIRLD